MTYTVERQIDTTYASVGGQLYQVPSTSLAEPVDDPNWKPNADVDCWVITLATKKLSCPPFKIHWWNGGKNMANGQGSVLEAFPECVILDWSHLSELPDEF